jgi:hypothetical protein
MSNFAGLGGGTSHLQDYNSFNELKQQWAYSTVLDLDEGRSQHQNYNSCKEQEQYLIVDLEERRSQHQKYYIFKGQG